MFPLSYEKSICKCSLDIQNIQFNFFFFLCFFIAMQMLTNIPFDHFGKIWRLLFECESEHSETSNNILKMKDEHSTKTF